MDRFWQCRICRAKNAEGAKRCALCRNPYDKNETPPKAIQIRDIPEWEEDSKVFDDLNARLERASVEIGKESLPPKAAIRLVVPNNPLGWLTVAIVVTALAMTLAILKTMF